MLLILATYILDYEGNIYFYVMLHTLLYIHNTQNGSNSSYFLLVIKPRLLF